MRKVQAKPFALCIDNNGYRASPILGKVYRILPYVPALDDPGLKLPAGCVKRLQASTTGRLVVNAAQ